MTDDRIALVWHEGRSEYGATLKPMVEGDVQFWIGDTTGPNDLLPIGEIRGRRYDLVDDGVILIARWHQYGHEGSRMYELYPLE